MYQPLDLRHEALPLKNDNNWTVASVTSSLREFLSKVVPVTLSLACNAQSLASLRNSSLSALISPYCSCTTIGADVEHEHIVSNIKGKEKTLIFEAITFHQILVMLTPRLMVITRGLNFGAKRLNSRPRKRYGFKTPWQIKNDDA